MGSAAEAADEGVGSGAGGGVTSLVAKARALVNAVSFDDNGSMIAGQWMGGNGGMLSRETIKAADALRREIDAYERNRQANVELAAQAVDPRKPE